MITFNNLVNKKILGIQNITNPGKLEISDSEFNFGPENYLEKCFSKLNKTILNHFYLLLGEDILNPTVILFSTDTEDRGGFFYCNNWCITDVTNMIDLNHILDSNYKHIGEYINDIWTDGYDLNTSKIVADERKWIATVGKGKYGPSENKAYKYISIRTNTKHIDLSTLYHNCHYPETIWDYI